MWQERDDKESQNVDDVHRVYCLISASLCLHKISSSHQKGSAIFYLSTRTSLLNHVHNQELVPKSFFSKILLVEVHFITNSFGHSQQHFIWKISFFSFEEKNLFKLFLKNLCTKITLPRAVLYWTQLIYIFMYKYVIIIMFTKII